VSVSVTVTNVIDRDNQAGSRLRRYCYRI